jgi:hypothetical protein
MLSIPERYILRARVRDLALQLMAKHGLQDWSFVLNRRKGALGRCRYARYRRGVHQRARGNVSERRC